MDAEKLREIGHKIAKMEGGEKDGAFIVQMALRLAMLEADRDRWKKLAMRAVDSFEAASN